MQKNQTITVKEAAALLELDERSIRERLITGTLKGEKKNVGQREKWFVYATAIEQELKQKRNAQSSFEMLKQPPVENNNLNFGPDTNSPHLSSPINHNQFAQAQEQHQQFSNQRPAQPNRHPQNEFVAGTTNTEDLIEDIVDVQPTVHSNWGAQEIDKLELLAEKLVKPLTEKIAAQAMMITVQEQQLEEQKRQIRLLPDLEKRAEEERKAAELRALEVEALNKQITALEQERKLQEAKIEKLDAVEAQLVTMSAELTQLKQPWWKKMFSTQ